jgi:predicted phage terminase large subunit-like protein
MQRPQPDEGTFFQREWFNWYDPDRPPKHVQTYAASDYAVTDAGGDFTEHGVFGVDPDDDLYVLDWWSGQTASDVWIEAQLDLMATHRPLTWYGEAGPIRRAIEPFLTRRMRERRIFGHLAWMPSITDKPTRARGFQARASMGKVYLPKNDLGEDLLRQLLSFPAGKNDDRVDVCSLIGRALDEMPSGSRPAEKPVKRDVWDKEDEEVVNWKTI